MSITACRGQETWLELNRNVPLVTSVACRIRPTPFVSQWVSAARSLFIMLGPGNTATATRQKCPNSPPKSMAQNQMRRMAEMR